MSEMTPEKLREAIEFAEAENWVEATLMDAAYAAATAWEADRTESSLKDERIVAVELALRTAEGRIEADIKDIHLFVVLGEERRRHIEALEKLLLRWSVFAGQLVDEWWAISPNQEPTSYTPEGLELKELLAATAISLAALAAHRPDVLSGEEET